MYFSILALQGRRCDTLRRVWALESELASSPSVSLDKLLNVSEPVSSSVSGSGNRFFFFRVVVRIK